MTAAADPDRPVLLRGRCHETLAPPRCLDFQARVGRPTAVDAGGAAPCVVVLTRTADREVDELSLWLAAAGVPLLRLDSDRIAGQDLAWDASCGVLATSEGSFAPRVSWLRYFSADSIAPSGPDDLGSYVRSAWAAWAPSLFASGAVAVNAGAAAGRPDRLSQLAAARAVGLRVPATLVTSRPGAAAVRLAGEGDLVVKSLGDHFLEATPGRLRGLFPRRVSRAELARDGAVEPAPVMVQEFVPSSRELRVYAVGRHLVAFAVRKRDVDSEWVDPDGVRVEAAVVPAPLAGPLRRLARRWRLDVAAFDLLDTPTGPVFLEVNAMCDWLWFERAAGASPVSGAVRELVASAYGGRGARSEGEGGRR